MATIQVNGAVERLKAGLLEAFMAERGYGPESRGVAVAVNEQVVPRSEWGRTELKDGDRIELVEPVQGG